MILLTGYADLQLAADAFGEPGRPGVLFLHGGGQTRHAWDESARSLAEQGWYVLTLDLRGHGDSAWAPDRDYTLDAFAEDIRLVAKTFRAPPAIIGASLGGLSALCAVSETVDHVASKLVLVDVAPRLEPEGVARIVGFMKARPDGFASIDEAADAIAEYLPHRPRPSDTSGLAKNLRRGEDGRYRWHWDPAFLAERRPNSQHAGDRLRAAARSLKVPTLLVRGRRSDLLSKQGVQEFLELVPGARFVDVAGAGHMVAGDKNDAFTAAILPFLEEA